MIREKRMDEYYMGIALGLAAESAERDEVPVGAIIVKDNEIIASSGNNRESEKKATAHAEIEVIEQACKKLGGWNLHDCELYVTLEPCTMCAGAIVNARIKTVIFGASDEKGGAFGGKFNLNDIGLNHRPQIVSGVFEEQCAAILTSFFREKRERGERWVKNKNEI